MVTPEVSTFCCAICRGDFLDWNDYVELTANVPPQTERSKFAAHLSCLQPVIGYALDEEHLHGR
jgi:hypothetical protein